MLAERGPARWWQRLSGSRAVDARAGQVLDAVGLSARRQVFAGTLSYAEQRALDLGIALASGAHTLLLDEPTAGMNRAEAARAIELIRETTAGRTLLMVEHDMDAVFVDRRPHFGARARAHHRDRHAGRDSRGCGGARGLSRRGVRHMSALLEIRALNAWYGASQALHGVDLAYRATAKCWRWSGATARAARRSRSAIMGLVRCEGDLRFAGRSLDGMRPSTSRDSGLATCPSIAMCSRR